MITRLTHAGIAFALTAILYQAYVLAVVPFIEPPWQPDPQARASTPRERQAARGAPERYREVLAAYFPADHWCFQRAPKIFENGQSMVVLDDYQQSDSGELTVPKCVIIFFPTVRNRGAEPPRDAVILEPARGAVLQMDQKLSRGVGGFGRMQFGQLMGDVVVRSDMREPGPQDDLLIVTKDLYMNEDLIRTAEPVEIRLGAHVGRGRELDIRFIKSESTHGGSEASFYGRLDSLEIAHEVSAVIAPGRLDLFGAPSDQASLAIPESDSTSGDPRAKLADAPIRIQSDGPFRIEFGSYLASFSDNVQVLELHPDGKLDELHAEELTLYFTKARRWEGTEEVTTTPEAGAPQDSSFALEPETIIAKGAPDKPVRLKAPSQQAQAIGQKLTIELTPRQVLLERGEGSDQVALTYAGGEIFAPSIRYQMPAEGSNERIGALSARGGAGRLRAILDPARPEQTLEVSWKDAMRLVRRNGQPVIVLDGRPQVSMIGVGRLWADSLELFLSEQAPAGALPRVGQSKLMPSSFVPVRLTASGSVAIESAELNGRVNQLDFKISYPSDATGAAGSPVESTQTLLPQANAAGRRSYDIAGIKLNANIVVRNRRPALTGIRVDGAVVFQEASSGIVGEPPLRIAAEHLIVAKADTPAAEIEIRGAGGTNGLPLQEAEIAAPGAIIRAPSLKINRGTSQAWIDSPGLILMQVDRDATGQQLATPEPVTIVWQESMRLDRDQITFAGDVRIEHAAGWLKTSRLVAALTAPVSFAGGQQKPQLARLDCREGARAEFDQRDETGRVTARQHIEVQSLSVDQISGAISGDGPGQIDSVHFASSTSNLIAVPGAAPHGDAEQDPNAESLRHLSIDFVRGVEGNLNVPEIRVTGEVKTVYGPVDDWNQRLEMTPGGAPGPQTIWIQCDDLLVTQSPAARLQPANAKKRFGPVELRTQGRVVVEGKDPRRGAFTMRGHRATYDQAKAMFVLEGDGRQPATIYHQQYPGAPLSPQSAQKMIYWQNTGDLEIQLRAGDKLQLNHIDLGQKPSASPTR